MTFRWTLAALTLAAIAPARAQQAKLHARMDAATYSAVYAIIDSAKRVGLPPGPIEDKALEGASAGAAGSVIVSTIRTFTAQLGVASKALGKTATIDELRAGVSAINAGVPSRDLARIHGAAEPSDRSIATALTVLGDIVARGVPVATSSNLVISLLRARVKDPELLEFDRAVRSDISHGADPSTAASARAKGTILAFGISKEKPPRGRR
jgi:hypothetical protein